MASLRKISLMLSTMSALGWSSVARVGIYRITKQLGLVKRRTPTGQPIAGDFLISETPQDTPTPLQFKAFSWAPVQLPPKSGWHANCLTGQVLSGAQRHWSDIPDFNSNIGDIKTVWEASRFDWLPQIAASVTPENRQTTRFQLNRVLQDWTINNPVNCGPNWKCGQETSLRVINLLVALRLLDDYDKPEQACITFVEQHLERVSRTLDYAIGQDNNHAISEAVALFIGGIFLQRTSGKSSKTAIGYEQTGRRALENSVGKLVFADGMFSQYSIVYHRMMLTLVSLAEALRREHARAPFSPVLISHMQAATHWMLACIDPVSGNAPNFGANDGTMLLNLDHANYRDFRPVAEFAARVFLDQSPFDNSRLAELFSIMGKEIAANTETHLTFPNGGMVVSRSASTLVTLRIPEFSFRPSQADGLHLDLWHNGVNILRDLGTYSYADLSKVNEYSGTQAHNTACFDGRDQMPRLGRFLFARWLKGIGYFDNATNTAHAEYTDNHACRHKRTLRLEGNSLVVTDKLSGFVNQAEVFWHLAPTSWQLCDSSISSKHASIRFEADRPFELTMDERPESLYYLQESTIPFARLVFTQPATLITRIDLTTEPSA